MLAANPGEGDVVFLTPNDRLNLMLAGLNEASIDIFELMNGELKEEERRELVKQLCENLDEFIVHYMSLSFDSFSERERSIFDKLNTFEIKDLPDLLLLVSQAEGLLESKLRTPKNDIVVVQSYFRARFVEVLNGFIESPSIENFIEIYKLSSAYVLTMPPAKGEHGPYMQIHEFCVSFHKKVEEHLRESLIKGEEYMNYEALNCMRAFLRSFLFYSHTHSRAN